MRASNPALRRGTLTILGGSTEVLVYKMTSSDNELFVVLNRADSEQAVPGFPEGSYTNLLDDTAFVSPGTIAARSALVGIKN